MLTVYKELGIIIAALILGYIASQQIIKVARDYTVTMQAHK